MALGLIQKLPSFQDGVQCLHMLSGASQHVGAQLSQWICFSVEKLWVGDVDLLSEASTVSVATSPATHSSHR